MCLYCDIMKKNETLLKREYKRQLKSVTKRLQRHGNVLKLLQKLGLGKKHSF
jgi:hypothetical protein